MIKRIKLDEYYNLVGRQTYADWSDDIILYHSASRKDFKHYRERANAVYAKAVNQIWANGQILLLSVRSEQGYFNAVSVKIDSYDFLQSLCYDVSGNEYKCFLEIKDKLSGRPKIHKNMDSAIHEFFKKELELKGNDKNKVVIEDIVRDLKTYFHASSGNQAPGNTTIRNRILTLYPECSKASRNSRK